MGIMEWFNRMILESEPRPRLPKTRDEARSLIKLTGREHDLRRMGWGHRIEKCGDHYAAWTTPCLRTGDIIITTLGRFIIDWSRACGDPPDMCFFTCIREKD